MRINPTRQRIAALLSFPRKNDARARRDLSCLGIGTKSLYTWKAQFSKSPRVRSEVADQAAEIRRLKRELARVTEGRTILKKGVAFEGLPDRVGSRSSNAIFN